MHCTDIENKGLYAEENAYPASDTERNTDPIETYLVS